MPSRRQYARSCNSSYVAWRKALVGPLPSPSETLYQLAISPAVGGLALLLADRITYADYALLMEQSSAKLNAQMQEEMRKNATEAQEQARKQAVLSLSCVVSSNPVDTSLNGVEFQYTIDTASNTVTASRGPAAPTNVHITPNLIGFNEGQLEVEISRATGRFTQHFVNNPFVISGTCEPIHSAKF